MGKNKKVNSIMDIGDVKQKDIMDELYRLEKGMATTSSIFEVGGNKKSKKKKKKYGNTGFSMEIEKAIAAKEIEENPDSYYNEEDEEEETAIEYNADTFTSIFPEPIEEEPEEEEEYNSPIENFNPVIRDSNAFKIAEPIEVEEEVEDEDEESVLDEYIEKLPDNIKNVIKHPDWFPTSKGIEFGVDTVLNRFVVNDGISPTTLALQYIGIDDEIDISKLDPDYMGHVINQLFMFIISSKHPTAVLTEDEFIERFAKYKHINEDEFAFFSVENYVLMYYINKEERNVLSEIPQIYNMDSRQVLQFYVTLFYRCNQTHNIFFIEDSNYIETYRSKKASKLTDYFMYLVDVAEETEISSVEMRENIYERLNVYSAKALQTDVRQIVAELTGDSNGLYDDEEDDNLAEIAEIVKEVDESADDVIVEDDDIDALLDYDLGNTNTSPHAAVSETRAGEKVIVGQTNPKPIQQSEPKTPKMTKYEQKSDDFANMTIPVMKKQR